MPYTIRKQKCKQSDGDSGSHVLSYTDKKGKKHRACHTSKKKAQGQIAAIEAESIKKGNIMKITVGELRSLIKEVMEDVSKEDINEKDLDKDDDGDEDFADVMMSRMVASGMPKEKALEKSRKHDK